MNTILESTRDLDSQIIDLVADMNANPMPFIPASRKADVSLNVCYTLSHMF